MAHLIQRPRSHRHPIPKPTHFDPIIPTPIRARAYNDLYQHPECIKNSIKWNPNLMLVLIASESGSKVSRFDAGFNTPILRVKMGPTDGGLIMVPVQHTRSSVPQYWPVLTPLNLVISSFPWDQGGSKWGHPGGPIWPYLTPYTTPLYARARTMICQKCRFIKNGIKTTFKERYPGAPKWLPFWVLEMARTDDATCYPSVYLYP